MYNIGTPITVAILVLVIVTIIVVWIVHKSRLKPKAQKQEQNFQEFLVSMDIVSIDLDTQLKIDGFHWQEDVIVDRQDNRMYGFEDQLYSIGDFEFVNKLYSYEYYRHSRQTQFSSKLYFDFKYKNQHFEIDFNLPVEHTKLRMRCYLEKEAKVYVIHAENIVFYLFDLQFLEIPYLRYLSVRSKDLESLFKTNKNSPIANPTQNTKS